MADVRAAALAEFENIPDADLWDIFTSIKDGARTPAESFGFTPEALNTIEQTALAYYRARRYGQAAALFGFVLRLDNRRNGAWRGLGAISQVQKNYGLAVRCYNAAVVQQPGDVVSMVLWGECLCLAGEKDGGLELLAKVVAGGSDDPVAKAYLVRAQAILAAKGAIPPRVVLMQRGRELAALGEEVLAGIDAEREITAQDMRKDPALAKLMDEVTKLLAQGKVSLAELGGFSKNELDGAYGCACEYAQMGRMLEAIQIVGYLQLINPYDARYYHLCGVCWQRMKQYELAAHYYQLALNIDGKDARSLLYAGECQIMDGHVDRGLETVAQGAALAKGRPDADELGKRADALLQQFKR